MKIREFLVDFVAVRKVIFKSALRESHLSHSLQKIKKIIIVKARGKHSWFRKLRTFETAVIEINLIIFLYDFCV